MGREVRMVPPNWEHPHQEGRHDRLQSMFDTTYEAARSEWLAGLAAHKPEECDGGDYWECEGPPPERKYYRPWKDQEATWYQLWETVSEGTPVSPPFETKDELAVYLAENGDYWDQSSRGTGGWGMDRAKAFVKTGWAPSMMSIVKTGSQTRILDSKDIPLELSGVVKVVDKH